jgi:hypothetical protein
VTSQGPLTPQVINSFAQFQKVYGGRGTYAAIISDSTERYFAEGGSRLVFCRVFGATAKVAKAELENAGKSAKVLKIEAIGPGIWANTFKVVIAVVEATKYTITVQNAAGEVLEISPAFSKNEEAASWSKNSSYITVTSLAAENPGAATAELLGGTDETAVTAANYETAAKKFSPEYGPGQISFSGVTSTEAIEGLFKVAYEQKRRAIADAPRTATKAELLALAAAIRALGEKARPGFIEGDWQEESPLAGTVSPRWVPGSAYVAAKCAVIDSLGNPNLPVAGKQATLGSLGKSSSFTEAEVEELYAAGINLCKIVNGQVRLYGNRTPVNPQSDPLHLQFSNLRLDMAIIWNALAIEESYMFSQLDGEGKDTAAYGAALSGMMLHYYAIGAVFGATPQQAYIVDTGTDVNTTASEAEGNLNGTIAVRRSPGADQVNLNLVRVQITQEV